MNNIFVGEWYESDPANTFHYIIYVTEIWNGSVYFIGIVDGKLGRSSISTEDFHDKYNIIVCDVHHKIARKMIDVLGVVSQYDKTGVKSNKSIFTEDE